MRIALLGLMKVLELFPKGFRFLGRALRHFEAYLTIEVSMRGPRTFWKALAAEAKFRAVGRACGDLQLDAPVRRGDGGLPT